MLRGHMHLIRRNALILCLFLCDQPLSLESSHAARAGRRDGLAVLFVLHVARGKDALDGRLGGTGHGLNVAVGVERELGFDEGGRGFVACMLVCAGCVRMMRLLDWQDAMQRAEDFATI